MEPKWNVKVHFAAYKSPVPAVLMEPKWNVKKHSVRVFILHIGINGTKVECKGG